jgi:hypothetical protein
MSEVLEKGLYNHPKIPGYLSVGQFIFTRKEGKKCLLLRFVNEADFRIDGAELTVIQLDMYGKKIGRTKIRYTDINVSPAGTFAPERGIIVSEKCVDFYVQMRSVCAKSYKYVFKNGEVASCYDPYADDEHEYREGYGGERTVKARFFGGAGIRRFITVVSALLVCAAIAAGAVKAQDRFGKFDGSEYGEESTDQTE